ncbi:MAG: hypothetical protein UT48_C0008G0009 [Parcubacteria group bacterium GW2011_GWE2_39_37]|uniref:ABC transporter permease n=1 Tax=Candidatus Falkowbacteria bacterium GW2011_GWF2_39_8 TaxID=1618642 RepID=A0A0G0SA46_9BACT|nr:MAG: hypothetical protein UT48_C0008G0009 [Parcubacteria group bacterium GW2011_GWE2_39_37]KKR31605.1 MAG: hypothetical protein UT64_C0055G0007 [Candidatus Falkowbacteria bacterium GW2011_GWF2_39_8]
MKKYWKIITNEFQRHLAYRANIVSYSFGHLFEIISQIVIWTVIFQGTSMIKGYTYPEMMTYVIIGWFILFATSNYGFEERIAKDIHQGTLSNMIVKPMSYVRYIIAVSMGRVVIALITVAVIETVLIFLLRNKIIINLDPATLLLMLFMLLVAFFIKLLFSILIGLIAFWIIEISGTYFSLNIFSKFMSGAYFPMNLLPAVFVNISLFFPFIYTFFIPLQLYLKKITLIEGLRGLGVELLWLFLLYLLIKLVWHFGLKKYEAAGV